MTNKIEHISSRNWRVVSVMSRRDADPELSRKFASLFSSRDDVPQNTNKNAFSTGLASSFIRQLSEVNHDVAWHSAEILRKEKSLTFRLLNGPMTGLTIVSSWQAEVVILTLKPKNQKQHETLNRITSKITARLSQSKISFQMDIVNYE